MYRIKWDQTKRKEKGKWSERDTKRGNNTKRKYEEREKGQTEKDKKR